MINAKIQGFILYKIYYGNDIVYLGRTKQPLQDRIRGHLFQKPMHRNIYLPSVTKIEYAEFKSEADMNVYEIYFINKLKPPFNCDDKAHDELFVVLPEVEWKQFETPLWEKWREQIEQNDTDEQKRREERRNNMMRLSEMRQKRRNGEITEDEYCAYIDSLNTTQ